MVNEEKSSLEKEQAELFRKLIQLNVNEHTEEKNNLTYLSWVWAWQEFKKICPTAIYEVKKFKNEITGETLPYIIDKNLGIIVFTSITAGGITHEMWLPVMDGANKAMRLEQYTYNVKKYNKGMFTGQYEEKVVEPATMFDINKTIMRCLTKNIAMFGLGLYIYAGEDLPIELGEPCTPKQVERMRELDVRLSGIKAKYKVETLEELTYQQAEFVINAKEKALKGDNNESRT